MFAIAKNDIFISSNNGKTLKGNKLRKDRKINKGEKLEVIKFYNANTYTRTFKAVKLKRNNIYLYTEKDNFKYEGNKTKEERHKEYTEKYINPLFEKFDKLREKISKLEKKIYSPIYNDCILKNENGEIKKSLTKEEKKEMKKIENKIDILENKLDKVSKKINKRQKQRKERV